MPRAFNKVEFAIIAILKYLNGWNGCKNFKKSTIHNPYKLGIVMNHFNQKDDFFTLFSMRNAGYSALH